MFFNLCVHDYYFRSYPYITTKEPESKADSELSLIYYYTIPIPISTNRATITTNAEIINPCIIG